MLKTSLQQRARCLQISFDGCRTGVPQLPSQACIAPDGTTLTGDELGPLLGNILEALSPEELGKLPKPVWALLDFIAAFDDTKATVSDRKSLS
jgi:hypothetical protein